MKNKIYLLILFFPLSCFGQNHIPISFENIFYNEKSFYTSINQLPKPDSIINPYYECGKFSEEQGNTFLQYYYDYMNYITYDSIAEIETIFFQKGDILEIEGKKISTDMNISKIAYLLKVLLPTHKF